MTILFVLFQNCEVKKGGGNTLVSLAGNGGAYDGKLLVEAPESATPGSKEEIKIDGGTKPYKVTVTPADIQLQKVSEDQYIIEIPDNIGSPNILIEVEDSGLGEDKQKVEASIQIIGKNQFLYKIKDIKAISSNQFVAFDGQSASIIVFDSLGQIRNSIPVSSEALDNNWKIDTDLEGNFYFAGANSISKYDSSGALIAGPKPFRFDNLIITKAGILYSHSFRKDLSLLDLNLKATTNLIDQSTDYESMDEYWKIESFSVEGDSNILIQSDLINGEEDRKKLTRFRLSDLSLQELAIDPRPSIEGYDIKGQLSGDSMYIYKEKPQLLPTFPNIDNPDYKGKGKETYQEVNPFDYFYFDINGSLIKKVSFQVPYKEGPKPSLKLLSKVHYGYVGLLGERIAFFDNKGRLINEWNSAGMNEREFDTPCDLAINDKDEVFVADANNRRIQVYDADMKLIHSYTDKVHGVPYLGNKGSNFCNYDISLDSKGRIYTTSGWDARSAIMSADPVDYNNYRLTVIDPYGHPDTPQIREALQYYIWVSNAIHLTVNDEIIVHRDHLRETKDDFFTSNRVLTINPKGEMIDERTEDWSFQGFDIENKSNGNFVVMSHIAKECGDTYCFFFEYDQNWNLIKSFGELDLDTYKENPEKVPMIQPRALAIDKSDNIYIADVAKHSVVIFDPDGNHLKSLGRKGTGPGEFYSPQGIAVDSKGNIIVSDTGNNRLVKLKPFEEL